MNDSDTFDQVETFFNDKIYKHHPATSIDDVNICCEEEEKNFLISMAEQLKEIYTSMTVKDLYIALIFSYYALNLGEQTTDYLNTRTFSRYADDYDGVIELFTLITTGDINRIVVFEDNEDNMMETTHNVNLSSQIRRHMFGMPYGGIRTRKKKAGKKKNKKRRLKKSKKEVKHKYFKF